MSAVYRNLLDGRVLEFPQRNPEIEMWPDTWQLEDGGDVALEPAEVEPVVEPVVEDDEPVEQVAETDSEAPSATPAEPVPAVPAPAEDENRAPDEPPRRPARSASRGTWVRYHVALGVDEGDLKGLNRDQLVELAD